MSNFTHLHVHTDASLIDGLGRVSRLVATAKSNGFNNLAITDHGTLANAVLFTIECEANGIKPILGVEGYVAVDGEIGHVTLLANGNEGFHNLTQLNNKAHAGKYQKPAFSIDDLIEHAKDIVCLTGCVASPLNTMSYAESMRLGAKLKDAFGNRLFAEIMFIADIDTWSRPLQLSQDLGIRPVITNDVHFPTREDGDIHSILTSMKAGFTYASRNLFLRTRSEIEAAGASRIDRGLVIDMADRTQRLGDMLKSVVVAREPSLPGEEGADNRLKGAVINSDKLKFFKFHDSDMHQRLVKRCKYELDIIKKMGYSSYFLILADIVNYAHANEIKVGPGRGSGAASAVLFLLGVTDINPIEYDLSFERFLNPERLGMPDVDVDFDSDTRQKVIDYAVAKWKASPVATYSRYSYKMLVHDLAKTMGINRDLEDRAIEEGESGNAFKEICEAHPNFLKAFTAINGQIRHKGKHAGGIVITDGDIPLERAGDSLVAAWTEGEHKELSYAGIVKFDLLGLSALTVLSRLEASTGFKAPPPEDDSPVFSIFREGKLSGIFQFSGSEGIANLTKKLAPTKFDDLVAINALYRPGALDVGSADKYPEWKKSPRVVHPSIAEILAPTYGAVVYQEQVMAIFAKITLGSLAQADLVRRVIIKAKPGDIKWEKSMVEIQGAFVTGAIKNHGMSADEATHLWDELASHSRYSFNKAHSVAYANIAWQLAWWKYYFAIDFYTQMLNVDTEQSQYYILDAMRNGIDIVPPHVNYSSFQYENDKERIFAPLSAIKFLGDNGAKEIISLRPFSSISDFANRISRKLVNSRARKGLWALDSFNGIVGPNEESEMRTLGILGKKESAPLKEMETRNPTMEYLGFIIPSKEFVKKLESESGDGIAVGIIVSSKDKTSGYGPYTVYRLFPNGIFWVRGLSIELKNGDFVKVKVKKDSGKALSIERL